MLSDLPSSLAAAALLAVTLAPAAPSQDPDPAHSGRALFLELGCVHCHAESTPGTLTAQSLAGPDLRRAGHRLRAAWMASWLADPRRLDPAARMPALFADDRRGRAQARDVASWLATLGGPLEAGGGTRRDGGERLFLVRGCVACHRLPGDPEDSRRLLRGLGAKTTMRELARYLRDPLAVHPKGAMPDLALSGGDAEALASFLIGAAPATAPAPAGDVERGAKIAAERRCAACHALPEATSAASSAPSLRDLTGRDDGCLAPVPAAGVPAFALTGEQRAALAAFLRDPTAAEPAREALRRRLAQLRCTACHEHDGGGGMQPQVRTVYHAAVQADAADHADPPSLAGAATRLRRSWVEAVLREHQRARPYMTLRMPHFAPALTAGLANLLVPNEPRADADYALADVEAGRKLVGSEGFSCIVCHDFAGRPATGTRAPDLARAYRRLQPSFLRRWISDPSSVRPGTRMPTYFQAGRSAVEVLGGRQDAQVRALIAYLAQGDRMRPPVGLGPAPDTMLVPTDHPLLWRTILPELDPRSLAIGFPAGLSVAFDVAAPRLGYVWQGGFLDMRRKWTGRGNGPCELIGAVLARGAGGAMFRRGAAEVATRFAGYRLGDEAVTLCFDTGGTGTEMTVSQVHCDAGLGLRLRVHLGGNEPLDVAIGHRPEGEPDVAVTKTAVLARLDGVDGAPCYLRAPRIAGVDPVTFRCQAGRNTEAVLWFPTSSTADALRQCLEWQP